MKIQKLIVVRPVNKRPVNPENNWPASTFPNRLIDAGINNKGRRIIKYSIRTEIVFEIISFSVSMGSSSSILFS